MVWGMLSSETINANASNLLFQVVRNILRVAFSIHYQAIVMLLTLLLKMRSALASDLWQPQVSQLPKLFAGSSRGGLNRTDHRSGDVDCRGMVEMQCSFIGDVADKNTPCKQTSCPFDPEATLGPTSDEPYPMFCKSLH